ncbi:MAG: hypothetical protein ACKESC_01075 [Candidatus Hodgkinia cicadicola]
MKKESNQLFLNILIFYHLTISSSSPFILYLRAKIILPTINTSPSFRHILIDRTIPSFGNDYDFIELISLV